MPHSTAYEKADLLPPSNVRSVPAAGTYATSLSATAEKFLPLKGDWPAGAYALSVTGECMAPEACDGDFVVAAPNEPTEPGDLAVVYIDGVDVPALKRIVSFAGGVVRVEMDNPPTCFQVAAQRVEAVHKIIAISRAGDVEPVSTIKLADLPMIRSHGRGKGVDFWSIDPPAGYDDGWDYGRELAFSAAQYALGRDPAAFGHLLADIAAAQAAAGPDESHGGHGARLGFWNTVGTLAASGVSSSNIATLREQYRQRREELKARLERQKAEDARARSERARHAALIGAAKRRAAREAA